MAMGRSFKQLGELYWDRLEFAPAIDNFAKAATVFFNEDDLDSYLECQLRLLRMFAEKDDKAQVGQLKATLEQQLSEGKLKFNSLTYYIFSLCASYFDEKYKAMDSIERSLELALASDNKVDICRAILARSYLLFSEGKVNEALNEITNLKVFFQVIAIPRMELSTQILLARIYQKLGQSQKALDTLWSSYEYLNKHKNLFLLVHLFYALGIVHESRGETELAKTHLKMAKSFAPTHSLKHFTKQIDKKLDEMDQNEVESEFDIVFDLNNPVIVEAERGEIDFKNQFVLMDLLRLFVENPGVVYSKESLVKEVWDQSYDPRVHDNKIYVTIKRLRKLIEPQTGESKYIFRSREGYFFNKRVKVCLKK